MRRSAISRSPSPSRTWCCSTVSAASCAPAAPASPPMWRARPRSTSPDAARRVEVADLPHRAVLLVLQRQHRADLPGRRTHGDALPLHRPALGPRSGRVHLHRLLGRVPGGRAARRRTASPGCSASTPPRSTRAGCVTRGGSPSSRRQRRRGRQRPRAARAKLADEAVDVVPGHCVAGRQPRGASRGQFLGEARETGRFEHGRLVEPCVRRGGRAGRRTAGARPPVAAAAGLTAAKDEGGARAVALIGGARLTNESAYAWAKLAMGIIGTDSVDAQLGERRLPRRARAGPALRRPSTRLRGAGPRDPGRRPARGAPRPLPPPARGGGRWRHAAARDRGGAHRAQRAGHGHVLAPPTGRTCRCRCARAHRRQLGGDDRVRDAPGGGGGDPRYQLEAARWLLASHPGGEGVVDRGRSALPTPSPARWRPRRRAAALADALPTGDLPAGTATGQRLRGARHGPRARACCLGRVGLERGDGSASPRPGSRAPGEHRPRHGRDILASMAGEGEGEGGGDAEGRTRCLVLLGAGTRSTTFPTVPWPPRPLGGRALRRRRHRPSVRVGRRARRRRAAAVRGDARARRARRPTLRDRVSRSAPSSRRPALAWPDWMIAAELAVALRSDLGLASDNELSDELTRTAPAYAGHDPAGPALRRGARRRDPGAAHHRERGPPRRRQPRLTPSPSRASSPWSASARAAPAPAPAIPPPSTSPDLGSSAAPGARRDRHRRGRAAADPQGRQLRPAADLGAPPLRRRELRHRLAVADAAGAHAGGPGQSLRPRPPRRQDRQ